MSDMAECEPQKTLEKGRRRNRSQGADAAEISVQNGQHIPQVKMVELIARASSFPRRYIIEVS